MRAAWLSAGAALMIVVSLGLKLAVLDVAVEEDQRAAVQALVTALAGQGYVAEVPRADLPIAKAQKSACNLTARILDPHGIFRDTELLKLPRGWSVAYSWRGTWQTSLPRLGPLVEYYIARQLARFGAAARHAPVIMLSIQPGCARPEANAVDVRVRLEQVAAPRRTTAQ